MSLKDLIGTKLEIEVLRENKQLRERNAILLAVKIRLEEKLGQQIERNAALVAALARIATLEGIQSESGRIACKALAANPTPR